MRIIDYFLQLLCDLLLAIADIFGWLWLKLLVYRFVLYTSIFLLELWALRWRLMNILTETLGEGTYAFFYTLALAFFVYFFLRLLTFILNAREEASFPGRRHNFRWIMRLLGFILLHLVMLTFVDWYLFYPDTFLFLHYYLGHEAMCFIEALAGLDFLLSLAAVFLSALS